MARALAALRRRVHFRERSPEVAEPAPQPAFGAAPASSSSWHAGGEVAETAAVPYDRIPIPAAAEVAGWVSALGAKGHNHEHAADLAARFCGLAYARQGPAPARSAVARARGRPQGGAGVVEFQFHGGGGPGRGAHCVAYLYGAAEGGVGVVLAARGPSPSLNDEDWVHTLRQAMESAGEPSELLCPDVQPGGARVHSLVAQHAAALQHRMRCCSLASIRGLLEAWRAPSSAPHFWAWLCAPGAWRWCAVVGHSFGGALAAAFAAEVAARSGGTVFLASLNSPPAGNAAFAALLEELVLPSGGLRIINEGDPFSGAGFANMLHGGRQVTLPCRYSHKQKTYHAHLWLTLPSRLGLVGGASTFQFPGCVQRLDDDAEGDERAFGEALEKDRVLIHNAEQPIPDDWLEDAWWAKPGLAVSAPVAERPASTRRWGWGGGRAP